MTSTLRLLRPINIVDAMIVACDVPEPATGADPDPAVYNAATTYALGNRAYVAATHTIYESVQAGNIGHSPLLDLTATWWVAVGATNRWRMFDQRNTSQTSRTGGIDLTLNPGEVYNGLAALNIVNVSAIQVTMDDPVHGIVYDTTTAMQAPPSLGDFYEYCFDPIEAGDTLVLTDLPTYRNADLRVQFFAGVTAVAAVGVLTIGQVKEIGSGLHSGVSVSIQDYSRKEVNAYGDYTIVERAFAKRTTFEMWIPRASVDQVQNLLASVRATPCVWIGSDFYKATVIFGFYKDFETTIAYYDFSVLNISLEGLT